MRIGSECEKMECGRRLQYVKMRYKYSKLRVVRKNHMGEGVERGSIPGRCNGKCLWGAIRIREASWEVK